MVLNNSKNKYVFIVIAITQLLLLLFLPSEDAITNREWSRSVSFVALIFLVFQLFSLRLVSPRKSFLLPSFIILSYLFTLSQIVLNAFNYSIPNFLLYSDVFRNSNLSQATNIAFKAISGLFLGMVTYCTFVDSGVKQYQTEIQKREPNLFFVVIVLLIGFLFDLIYNIYMGITLGYGDVEGSQLTMLLRLFSLLFSSGFALVVTRSTLSQKSKRNFLIIFIVYKVLCMLLGYRAFALINIVLALYLYGKICGRLNINLKKIIILIVVAVLSSSFLVAIRDSRQTGVEISYILSSIGEANFESILNIFAENGVSMGVICTVLDNTNGIGNGGQQIIASLLTLLPGASILFPGFNFNKMVMDSALDLRNSGGSYIGDCLFDFGTIGLIPATFFLGILLSKVFVTFETAIYQKRVFFVSFFFPIIVDIFFCVRSTTSKIPREILWYFVLFFIIWFMLSGRGFKIRN